MNNLENFINETNNFLVVKFHNFENIGIDLQNIMNKIQLPAYRHEIVQKYVSNDYLIFKMKSFDQKLMILISYESC